MSAALAAASPMPAAARAARDLQVGVARDGLVNVIALHPEGMKNMDAIRRWAAALSADEVLQTVASLQPPDPRRLDAVIRTLIADALKAAARV